MYFFEHHGFNVKSKMKQNNESRISLEEKEISSSSKGIKNMKANYFYIKDMVCSMSRFESEFVMLS